MLVEQRVRDLGDAGGQLGYALRHEGLAEQPAQPVMPSTVLRQWAREQSLFGHRSIVPVHTAGP